MLPTLANNFLATLGFLGVTVLGVTGFAYLLFKSFSEGWLNQRFTKQLEDHKHAQQRELEKLKLEINTTMDRKVKLHQLEFSVLPRIWELLSLSYGEVCSLVSRIQAIPDLNRLGQERVAEFLEDSQLTKSERGQVLSTDDKTKMYGRLAFWPKYTGIRNRYNEFYRYYVANAIFLNDDLKEKIDILINLLDDAMYEKEEAQGEPDVYPKRYEKADKLRRDGDAMLKEIELKVRAVLWRESVLQGRTD